MARLTSPMNFKWVLMLLGMMVYTPISFHLSTLLGENVTASLSSEHLNFHPHHDLTSYFTEKI